MKFKKIGIIGNPTKKGAIRIINELLKKYTGTKSIKFYINIEVSSLLKKRRKTFSKEYIERVSELIVVLGGDGTVLSVARLNNGCSKPIFAVNVGGLGFLTQITSDEFFDKFEKVIQGKDYFIEKRMLLKARVKRKKKNIFSGIALNDVVISIERIARVINLKINVDKKFLSYFYADGVIVSSPTGSTAYSLSSGGPIVYPTKDMILLTPICPHTLTNRPIIFPEDVNITIENLSLTGETILTMDGQLALRLKHKDQVEVAHSKKYIKMIHLKDRTFFEILRKKLNWGTGK